MGLFLIFWVMKVLLLDIPPYLLHEQQSSTMSSRSSLKRITSILLPIALFIGLISSAWKVMCVITGSSHPVMVVSSESMEPAFYRGDIILLWNHQEEVNVGDIPVVWFPGRRLPMVHRAITVLNQSDGNQESMSR